MPFAGSTVRRKSVDDIDRAAGKLLSASIEQSFENAFAGKIKSGKVAPVFY